MLKKTAALITAVLLVISFAACGEEKDAGYSGSAETAEEIDVSELPDGFGAFIARFLRYRDPEGYSEYDSSAAGESNILEYILIHGGCADWKVYGMSSPEYHNRENDPAGRQTGEGYQYVSAENADYIASEIFHVTEKDIEALRQTGDSENVFYVTEGTDGKEYYVVLDMMGAGENAVKIVPTAARYDGGRYYIVYDRCEPDGFTPPGQPNKVYGQGYAVMGVNEDGYWTMYEHSRTVPEVFGTQQ